MAAEWIPTAVAALAAVVAIACGGEGGEAGARGSGADGVTVRDSAGVEIVENETPAWREDEGWSIAQEPQLRLGTATGGGPEQFGSVSAVVRLSDGRIAVADGDAQEIRIFSADGEHVATAGGEGGGPGEFSQLAGLAAGPADTLVALGGSEGTLVFFGPGGAFVREVRPETGEAVLGRRIRGVFDDGTLASSRGFDPRSMMNAPGGITRDTQPEFRLARDGSVRDTLGRFPGRERSGGARGPSQIFFGRDTHFAVGGAELLVGDDARWEIRVYDLSGRLLRILRKPHEPVRVRPEDVDRRRKEATADLVEAFEDGNFPGDVRKRVEERMREAPARETLPAFAGLRAAPDGHLWVKHATRPGEGPPRWDVFDPEGRWLGTVETPSGLRVEHVGSDHVLGVREGDLGVQRVEAYAIRKP